jgi:hypothetical protein
VAVLLVLFLALRALSGAAGPGATGRVDPARTSTDLD